MKDILVVEDDEEMKKMMRTMLEKSGYNVLEASNGSEAEAIFREYLFDAVCSIYRF